MFDASKVARLGKDTAAKEGYDTNAIDRDLRTGIITLKDGWYMKAIMCPVVGCGDTCPKDHDPESWGNFFKYNGNEEDLMADFVSLVERVGGENVADWLNSGADLKYRKNSTVWKLYKLSTRKVSDADKFAWYMANKPEEFRKAIASGSGIVEIAKLYDDVHVQAETSGK